MSYRNLLLSFRYFFSWVRSPANDNWPVVDQISVDMPRKASRW